MKIRNGYVSNSSSSSFLIIYKDINDFNKFEQFEGGKKFINDISKDCDKKEIKNLIYQFIDNECYQIYDMIMDKVKDMPGYNPFNDLMDNMEWCNLKNYFNYNEEESYELMNKIREKGDIFISLMKKRKINYKNFKWDDKDVMNFRNDIKDLCYNTINNIVDKFLKSDNVKGFIFKYIEYEDHDREGSYMEHQFMPFIRRSPENKYLILCQNNH